ncbi:MAG: hypothetical protein FRX49_11696 [Trebouxia sp. A1-2]|nr:MAG: hypothetical protein FRX49_11696 [Trebouxia sp. A1-2]
MWALSQPAVHKVQPRGGELEPKHILAQAEDLKRLGEAACGKVREGAGDCTFEKVQYIGDAG